MIVAVGKVDSASSVESADGDFDGSAESDPVAASSAAMAMAMTSLDPGSVGAEEERGRLLGSLSPGCPSDPSRDDVRSPGASDSSVAASGELAVLLFVVAESLGEA